VLITDSLTLLILTLIIGLQPLLKVEVTALGVILIVRIAIGCFCHGSYL